MRKASSVLIEISGMCNANCPYCAQHRLKLANHFGGIMSPELFSQLIDHLFKLEILDKNTPPAINLFNWGEPFLNPKINEILRILASKKLNAGISTNLILRPNIDKENYPVIKHLIFSLSGFNQESYGRIHGASFKTVIDNFENIYADIKRYSPKTSIIISWHRYLFNEGQFWDAYRYFDRPGITFTPYVAYLNDGLELLDFVKEKLPEDRRISTEKDISLEHMRKGIAYCKGKSKSYHCPAWDFMVVDEIGQLLLCCGTTRYDSTSVLGNLLEMSTDDIWKSKDTHPMCKICITSGLALWVYNQNVFKSIRKPLPSKGGMTFYKFYYKYFRAMFFSFWGSLLRKLPNGNNFIKILKKQ